MNSFDGCLAVDDHTDLQSATGDLAATAGVCLFTDEVNRPILLLATANLRGLVRRRLTAPPSPEPAGSTPTGTRRPDLGRLVRRVWFRRTWNWLHTEWTYFRLAQQIYPDDYQEQFGRLEAWFLWWDPDRPASFFEVSKRPDRIRGRAWGPFATKKSALSFRETLFDLFDLCRCPERMGRINCAASCPYAQMQRCGASRHGLWQESRHRRLMQRADRFLADIPTYIQRRQDRMARLAERLRFEQAQNLKHALDRARDLRQTAYRWVMPLERFDIYGVFAGPSPYRGRRREPAVSLCGCIIDPGGIEWFEPVVAASLESAAEGLWQQWDRRRRRPQTRRTEHRSDRWGWIARTLYHPSRDTRSLRPAGEIRGACDVLDLARRAATPPSTTKISGLSLDSIPQDHGD